MKAAMSLKRVLSCSLALVGIVGSATAADKLVVEAGRIITVQGPEIVDGVIVIEDGRITAIGPASEVEKPWDAPVVGGPEFTAFPGFIEAKTSRGLDRANESVDVAPFLDVRDSLDPINFFFEDCLRWGMTTINVQQGEDCVIAGRGRVVKPHGDTVEEMTVRPSFGLVLSASPKRGKSRATQSQALRQAFVELREHLEQLVQEKRDGDDRARREALYQGRDLEGERAKGRAMSSTAWKVDGLELVPRGEVDEKQEPLLDLVEGRVAAFFHCSQPMDVHRALEIARDNGFLARTTLVLGPACWKAADVVAEAGVPAVLSGDLTHTERDPVTGDEIETFVPTVYEEAGVRFALSSENSSTRSLWYQAALAVGGGVPRETAIEAVTRVPAEILGLGDRVGALAEGMDGNVVILTGDPLSSTTWVDTVVLEGEAVYRRDEDVRNRHLLEGIAQPGTQPSQGSSDFRSEDEPDVEPTMADPEEGGDEETPSDETPSDETSTEEEEDTQQ